MNRLDDILSGVRSATLTEIDVLVREVRVRIGVLSRRVTIRIYADGAYEDRFRFETSSVLKTAAGGDASGDETAESENEALRRAVRSLTQAYEDAVRRGEMPDEAWLVEP